jgi:nucleoside-diphosphate-sugar epimerase
MKVLVTGGGGFLGQAICRQLVAQGHTIRTLSRQHYAALDALGVEQRSGDIASLDIVVDSAKGIDAIVHSAGRVGAWGRIEDYYETNVRGTDKLVLTSSPSVVHNGSDLEGVDESVPYATHFSSPYAQTKALAEQRVLAANSAQLATVALRPHFIWGPGDPNLLPRILGRARRGQLRLLGDVAKKIDTVYVDNAAEAHVLALEKLSVGSPIAGKVYFISQGEPVTHQALINSWLKADGFPAEARHMPLGLAQFLAGVFESVYGLFGVSSEPPLTRFLVEQLSTSHWFNIDAARRDLGYSPRVSMAEGLARLSQHLARERMQQRQ